MAPLILSALGGLAGGATPGLAAAGATAAGGMGLPIGLGLNILKGLFGGGGEQEAPVPMGPMEPQRWQQGAVQPPFPMPQPQIGAQKRGVF